MATAVLPLGISFKAWSDQIRQDLPNLIIPIAEGVEDWRYWASFVVNDNALSDVPVPTILAYPDVEDWKIWASYFVDSINNLAT